MTKVGVIGVGRMGYFHAKVYSQLEGVKLIGICDKNTERAADIAEELETSDYLSTTLLLSQCDAVSIAVPPRQHYEVAKQALLAGCSVLLEKPGCETTAQLADLYRIAKQEKLVLEIGFIERFNPAVRTLLWAEPPLSYSSFRSRPHTSRTAGVDVVLDLMIHDIDLLLQLDSTWCRELVATGGSYYSDELDFVYATVIMESGLRAELVASALLPNPVQRTTLLYRDKAIMLDLNEFTRMTHRDGCKAKRQVYEDPNKLQCELVEFIRKVELNTIAPLVQRQSTAFELALRISNMAKKGLENG